MILWPLVAMWLVLGVLDNYLWFWVRYSGEKFEYWMLPFMLLFLIGGPGSLLMTFIMWRAR